MKKVERYECFYLSDQGCKHDALSKKHPEGWWVDYDDHEQAIRDAFAAGAEAMRERLKNAFPTLASPIDAEVGPIFPGED